MCSFDNFTYALESGRTTMIRRQACVNRQSHVLSGVGEDDRGQTTGIRSFDNFTYELGLGRSQDDRDQKTVIHSFDNFTYFLELEMSTVIRR